MGAGSVSPLIDGAGDLTQESVNYLMGSANGISMNGLDSSDRFITTSHSTADAKMLHQQFAFSNSATSTEQTAAVMRHEQVAYSSRAAAIPSQVSVTGNSAVNDPRLPQQFFMSGTTSTSFLVPACSSSAGLTSLASSAVEASCVNDMPHEQLVAFIASIMSSGYAKTGGDSTTFQQSLSNMLESAAQAQTTAGAQSIKGGRSAPLGGGAGGGLVVASSLSNTPGAAFLPTAVVVPIKREKVVFSPTPLQDGGGVRMTMEQVYSLPPFETLVSSHPPHNPTSSSQQQQVKTETVPATGTNCGSSIADRCPTVQRQLSQPRSETVRLPGIQQLLQTHSLSSPLPAAGNSRSSTPGSPIGSPSNCDGASKQNIFTSHDADRSSSATGRSPSFSARGLPPPPPYPGKYGGVGGVGKREDSGDECKRTAASSADNEYLNVSSTRRAGNQSPASASLCSWPSDLQFGDLPVTSSF